MTDGKSSPLPYGRHLIEDDDVAAVAEALRSDWLTTGPRVAELERAFADGVGAAEAVAVSSGTAALHAAVHALGIGPGDEVIVPAITFVATASCVVMEGARPVFADVSPDTMLIDPEHAATLITPRTKALFAVDYAGQPCDYDTLEALCREHGIALLADGCHALGARHGARPVGSLAAATAFSLHPVKHITAGEGGIVTTNDPDLAARARRFRNHGISRDHAERAALDTWAYDVTELGYNYRLTDFQCALASSQLHKLPRFVARRRELAARYDAALAAIDGVEPLRTRPAAHHSHHLYVVRVAAERRAAVFDALRGQGIGVNVHYVPVHLHSFYRQRFGTGPGDCPAAEATYARALSLPIFPAMSNDDVTRVVGALSEALANLGDGVPASTPP
jgi:perosamine synthetase